MLICYVVLAMQVPDLALFIAERGCSEPAERSSVPEPVDYLLLDGQCQRVSFHDTSYRSSRRVRRVHHLRFRSGFLFLGRPSFYTLSLGRRWFAVLLQLERGGEREREGRRYYQEGVGEGRGVESVQGVEGVRF